MFENRTPLKYYDTMFSFETSIFVTPVRKTQVFVSKHSSYLSTFGRSIV